MNENQQIAHFIVIVLLVGITNLITFNKNKAEFLGTLSYVILVSNALLFVAAGIALLATLLFKS
jgi:hypothetical protein